MGFNSVYRVLQEVFPQVDSRILRAVAIENSKDADVAVEVVLAEIMPSLSIPSGPHISSSKERRSFPNPFKAHQVADALTHVKGGNFDESSGGIQLKSDFSYMNSTALNHGNNADEDHDQVYIDAVSDNINLSRLFPESSTEEGLDVLDCPSDQIGVNNYLLDDSNAFVDCLSGHEEDLSTDANPLDITYSVPQVAPSSVPDCSLDAPKSSIPLVSLYVEPIAKCQEPESGFLPSSVTGENMFVGEMVDHGNESMLPNTLIVDFEKREPSVEEPESGALFSPLPEQDISSGEMVCFETKSNFPGTSIVDLEKGEPSDSSNAASKKDLSTSGMDDLEDETSTNNILMTRSGQICSTEVLQDLIENAKNEKITLCSVKDLLVNLMNEVELKEKYVEHAREEATQVGLDKMARVEVLKQMVQHAKEANDMHAGEVYGEKAILATEVRELQSRLHSLSDERVKALATLDEVRQVLEARLTSAEEEIKEAKCKKLEKEDSAQKCLAYEESAMEKVVQESKILEQQAEENSKLREFLMDRGRLVDTLQGEISVICQDVKFMKEKFDQRIPLGKSLSSSNSISALAFSSSSSESMASEQAPDVAVSPENPQATVLQENPQAIVFPENPNAIASNNTGDGEEVPSVNKELLEDGWEFFDTHNYGSEFRL